MKTIVEKPVGGDGAVAGLYIDDSGNLEAKISYPISKLLSPIKGALDPLRMKLEKAIPGQWADPLIDEAFNAAYNELVVLLSGNASPVPTTPAPAPSAPTP